eukprot:8381657-Pyramimonas_sp.AAC.1
MVPSAIKHAMWGTCVSPASTRAVKDIWWSSVNSTRRTLVRCTPSISAPVTAARRAIGHSSSL